MKFIKITTWLLISVVLVSCQENTKVVNNTKIFASVFPKGEKVPVENFTGTVWARRLVQMDASGNYSEEMSLLSQVLELIGTHIPQVKFYSFWKAKVGIMKKGNTHERLQKEM